MECAKMWQAEAKGQFSELCNRRRPGFQCGNTLTRRNESGGISYTYTSIFLCIQLLLLSSALATVQ